MSSEMLTDLESFILDVYGHFALSTAGAMLAIYIMLIVIRSILYSLRERDF